MQKKLANYKLKVSRMKSKDEKIETTLSNKRKANQVENMSDNLSDFEIERQKGKVRNQ